MSANREQLVVPLDDLDPVGLLDAGRVGVERGDRGLGLVLAEPVARERGVDEVDPLGDEPGVPLAAVLVGERHEAAVRSGAAAAAGLVEEHQGEQALDLGIVHQGHQLPGQSDRLGGEVDVTGVALVEDEVQHPHHRAHVAGAIDTRPADRALGPADALGHGGLGHEVGLRDLAGGEAPHGAEGQRHGGRRRQVGVGTQEVEAQRVVGARDRPARRFGVDSELSITPSGVRPRRVEEDPPGDGDEPGGGVGGAFVLPRGEGPEECLLDGVLGGREVCAATEEDAQDPGDELAQLDLVHVTR